MHQICAFIQQGGGFIQQGGGVKVQTFRGKKIQVNINNNGEGDRGGIRFI